MCIYIYTYIAHIRIYIYICIHIFASIWNLKVGDCLCTKACACGLSPKSPTISFRLCSLIPWRGVFKADNDWDIPPGKKYGTPTYSGDEISFISIFMVLYQRLPPVGKIESGHVQFLRLVSLWSAIATCRLARAYTEFASHGISLWPIHVRVFNF